MAQSVVKICNMALRHLAHANPIVDIDEESEEAWSCSSFFEANARELQAMFPWNFCTSFAAGQEVEAAPTSEWGYSFAYFSDCLKVRRILSGRRRENETSPIPFRVAVLSGRKVILCDPPTPTFEYSAYVSDVTLWSPQFVRAFAYYHASQIGPTLTKGDPHGMQKFALQLYAAAIEEAKKASIGEMQHDQPPTSSLEEARGGW